MWPDRVSNLGPLTYESGALRTALRGPGQLPSRRGAKICIIFRCITVQILCIGTDRSEQTVQTKIRLLLKKQSDQGLRCLPFHQHLLDALMKCYIKLFYF